MRLGAIELSPFLRKSLKESGDSMVGLIELLMKGGLYTQQILSNLNIDASDSDLMKAVDKQFSRGGLRLA